MNSPANQESLFSLSPEETARRTKQVEPLKTIYVNHARIAGGYMDVRIFLGEQSVTPVGEVTFTEEFCLAMTPEFAKLLAGLLVSQMTNYENIFGKIRPAPQQTPEILEAIAKAKNLPFRP